MVVLHVTVGEADIGFLAVQCDEMLVEMRAGEIADADHRVQQDLDHQRRLILESCAMGAVIRAS